MPTVAIIGAGDLGGAAAQALAARGTVHRIVLIDAAEGIAAGKALDIQQSSAIDASQSRVTAATDLHAVAGASVCVVADHAGPPAAEWSDEQGLAMLARVLSFNRTAPIVFAGTSQANLILRGVLELKTPRERLVGSATEALTSAVRSLVALEARCSPSDVSVGVLGAPPRGFVVPWSGASICGYRLDDVLSPPQLARLEARVRLLWPLGPYALGAAAASVADAVPHSSRRLFNLLTLLEGEFSVRHRVGVLPVLLSPAGVEHRFSPSLSSRESVQLQTALKG